MQKPLLFAAAGAVALSMSSGASLAQNRSALLEEVLVTATKKAEAEKLQDVPIAATAFGEGQLEALFVRDLQSLSYSMPNVSMDDIGTSKGVANFSFRGLGVNSSIPSIDPTVGVFVDGVYQGTNSGVVFDQFDMEGIEVLRGPQGILFGRNVTGGAVLIRTTDPTEELTLKTRAAVQSGEDYYYSLVTTGALVPGKLLGKFAVYYNDDGGYFKNKNTGNGKSNDNFGQSETMMLRLAATYLDQGGGETTLKIEEGSTEGDGPPGQNHAVYDRDTFDFAIDEEGENDSDWSRITLEHVRSVGDGTLTNILGWKDLETYAVTDIDALPVPGFHAAIALDAEQISNELRYNILLNERFDVTAGLYYFQQDLTYIERRIIQGGAQDVTGGGVQDTENWGIFTAVDYRLSEALTLLAGLRYTQEKERCRYRSHSFQLL